MDRYNCFAELSRSETEGLDYRIRMRCGPGDFAIVAPHGGKIERGTSQLAEAVAGDEYTFYTFEGIKDTHNHQLHITSDHFDEPLALALVERVHTVITIHGAKGQQQAIYTGGLNLDLEQRILAALNAAGFAARHDPSPTRQGLGMTNICNRGYHREGVQLELTQGLRQRLFNPVGNGAYWVSNRLFDEFVLTVRTVLGEIQRVTAMN